MEDLRYSVIVGRLKPLDLPLLRREYTQFLWVTWSDVLEVLREKQDNISTADLNLLIAELVGHIPQPQVSEEVRKLLAGNPLYLLHLLNDERAPLSGGTSLPWPALQAALAAHFADYVFVRPQPSPWCDLSMDR